jgi:type IV secretion system protein VirB2
MRTWTPLKSATAMKPTRIAHAGNACALGLATAVLSLPAHAQFTKATTALTTLQTWLFGLGITIATMAILFVGYRMMFKRESFGDHAHVFWGGLIAAMAPTLAGWFFA